MSLATIEYLGLSKLIEKPRNSYEHYLRESWERVMQLPGFEDRLEEAHQAAAKLMAGSMFHGEETRRSMIRLYLMKHYKILTEERYDNRRTA